MLTLKTWMISTAALYAVSAAFIASPVRAQVEEVQVELKQGPIFAKGQPAGEERFIYAFKGIPYAKPPLGDLRFMAPVAAEGWTEPRNGSWNAPMCMQHNSTAESKINGVEDCLYLNVFTPKPFPADLPVIVHIHGGGYAHGSMDIHGPFPLLTKDIILVTIQYRLGTLGFLSTEDSVLPGNMGMKDQTMALQWVRDNIRDLGGDPNRVTLMGESAGSSSVHFHLITPHSKGLFHQAIMQAGMMLCPWALGDDHRDSALKISEMVNCPSGDDVDTNELLSCLQSATAESLVTAPSNLSVFLTVPNLSTPRVDGVYLPEHPATLLWKGHYNRVSLLAGFTKDEGSYLTAVFLPDKESIDELKENFTQIGPLVFGFTSADGDPLYLSKRVSYHYIGVAEFPLDNLDGFSDMMGDRWFKSCHDDAYDIHAKDSISGDNMYTYELHHRANSSYIENLTTEPVADNWVTHGDEFQYLFHDTPLFRPLERGDDVFVGDMMVSMWTNFVITGNPTPDMSLGFKWLPSTTENRQSLIIKPSPFMLKDPFAKNREFWRNLPTRQNKILYSERFR